MMCAHPGSDLRGGGGGGGGVADDARPTGLKPEGRGRGRYDMAAGESGGVMWRLREGRWLGGGEVNQVMCRERLAMWPGKWGGKVPRAHRGIHLPT